MAKRLAEPKRTCAVCDGKFVRGRQESTSNFLKREICSRKCTAMKKVLANQADVLANPRICENSDCKKNYYRRIHSETKTKFAKRRTCSTDCGHVVRKKKPKAPAKARAPRSTTPKKVQKATLPPAAPLKRVIPPPPKPVEVVVWRPESWGGSYVRKVS